MRTVLYFHGFLSTPSSQKVRLLRDALQREKDAGEWRLIAPDLNYPPRCVSRLLDEIAERIDLAHTAVIGSSLGGFFASRFARRYRTSCVLLNPCFDPWTFIPDFLGPQFVYGSQRQVDVKPSFAQDFLELAQEVAPGVDPTLPELALISLNDEVLDSKKTWAACAGVWRIALTKEDHRIAGFDQWIPLVMAFLRQRLA